MRNGDACSEARMSELVWGRERANLSNGAGGVASFRRSSSFRIVSSGVLVRLISERGGIV